MIVSQNTASDTGGRLPATAGLLVLLAVWLGITYVVGSSGLVAANSSEAFRPVLLTIVAPLAAFLAVYAASQGFRRFVLSQDIRFLTMLQGWRVIGFAFLVLYAHDVLPALFAWPAGFGDILIGLAAPFVVATLARRPDYARSRGFAAFHALGMIDFIAAAGTASLASGAFPALLSGLPTSAPMEVWPLILFPAFLVPIFLFLHLAVLFQVHALRRLAARDGDTVMQAA